MTVMTPSHSVCGGGGKGIGEYRRGFSPENDESIAGLTHLGKGSRGEGRMEKELVGVE